MAYHNLDELIELLESELDEFKYYWSIGSEGVLSQTGVVRMNCIDCLDRTNVVQTCIARHIFKQVMARLGVQYDSANAQEFESTFKCGMCCISNLF
jgi:hypothetical protein